MPGATPGCGRRSGWHPLFKPTRCYMKEKNPPAGGNRRGRRGGFACFYEAPQKTAGNSLRGHTFLHQNIYRPWSGKRSILKIFSWSAATLLLELLNCTWCANDCRITTHWNRKDFLSKRFRRRQTLKNTLEETSDYSQSSPQIECPHTDPLPGTFPFARGYREETALNLSTAAAREGRATGRLSSACPMGGGEVSQPRISRPGPDTALAGGVPAPARESPGRTGRRGSPMSPASSSGRQTRSRECRIPRRRWPPVPTDRPRPGRRPPEEPRRRRW